ncbi:MAG: recombination protein RecT [Alicyclobacillus macrosporangiidus]|uniref:recombination protein RecT n=1 Tax=Alicyclobacillus macrosporangiidus TaxID=392015 RepID=UPI0026EEBCFA|nr:recombination protein RecT [Alicyclobacillus macrosporangiidus]MCL6599543.1 recombination protein RecT [Alicyclobacillus macrosporangiidus]
MARVNGGNTALTERLQERVQRGSNGGDRPQSPAQTIAAYLKKMEPQFAQVLPKHVDKDRLLRIALTTIRTNPKLLECTVPSLMAAVMQAAQLGLEPGLLGHCYIIPYGKEATFVIGYKGMIDLARRSGNIQSINAHEVYENDYFELTYGLEENLKHIPWHVRTDEHFDQPGELRGAYMVAHFRDGGHYIHYMPKHEIEQHRKRSKAANNGPWVTDYIEMCKKTVVRAGWKWLPISIEIAEQVARSDESTHQDIGEIVEGPTIDLSPAEYSETSAAEESAATQEPQEPAQTGLDIGGEIIDDSQI